MKRREFLVAAGLTGVMPRILRASTPSVPCPPPNAHAGSAAPITTGCSAVNPETDWVNRISQPRVVWYNGFMSAAEVDLFRWTGGIGNDPSAKAPDASVMQWNASGGPGNFPYLSITRGAGTKENESVWWRPFSPMTAASNGKGVNDPACGGSVPLQAWTPQGNVNELAQWNSGWYSSNPTIGTAGPDGVDYWVQLRCKMDPNASAPGMNQPCKFFELGVAFRTLTVQNLVTYLNGSLGSGTNYLRVYNDGAAYSYNNLNAGYQNFVMLEWLDPGYLGNQYTSGEFQNNGILSNYSTGKFCSFGNPPTKYALASPSHCWAWSGGWDTVLYHVTPGAATGTGPHGGSVCKIQIYAANPGQTSYTKIWDQTYELGGWGANDGVYDAGKAGYQTLWLGTYSNGFNQPFGFTSRYGQIIFAKGDGTDNIPIPCPQV